MLTALSVARECHMVDKRDKVILVQAFPPQTDKTGKILTSPNIEYVYADKVAENGKIPSEVYNVCTIMFL